MTTHARARHRRILTAAVLSACAATLPAHANTDAWTGPTGSWSTASNWSLGTTPASGDSVSLTQTDALNRTVTLNVSPPSLSSLTVDSTGTGLMALSQSANSLLASSQYVGYSGTGQYTQTGGSNLATGSLRLGYNAGATGTYSLSGTAALSVSGSEYVGLNGNGTFLQTGGTNTATFSSSSLYLGAAPGSSGTDSLSGGTASFGNRVNVGGGNTTAGGAGVLNLSGSAALTATSTFKIWDTPGTAVNFSGGSLTVGALDTSKNPSRFNWTAGSLTVTGSNFYSSDLGTSITLTPAKSLSVNGYFNLVAGTSLAVAGGSLSINSTSSLYIPAGATVSLDGGSLTTAGLVAEVPGAVSWTSGALNITGGGLTISSNLLGPNLTLGADRPLSITGNSGPLVIPAGKSLTVAGGTVSVATLGSGTYVNGALAVTDGTLSTTGLSDSYSTTAGTITVSGGSLAVSNSLSFSNPGSVLNLTGGTLSAPSLNILSSALNWTAGTLSLTGSTFSPPSLGPISPGKTLITPATVTLGPGLTLSGGSITVGAISTSSNPGSFSWTSGTLAITGSLTTSTTTIGNDLALPAGKVLSVGGTLRVPSTSTFQVNGGTLIVGSILSCDAPGANLSAGSIGVSGVELFGDFADASFLQTGGANSAGELRVENNPGRSATYTLAGGTLTAGTEYVGKWSQGGTLAQSGGTNTVSQTLLVGGSGNGLYNLTAGSLSARSIYIGGSVTTTGVGTFIQTGGTLSASNAITLPYPYGGSGTYTLSSGTASAPNIYVGTPTSVPTCTGTLSVTGGSLTTPGTLKIYNTPNTSVSLSGGTLSLSTLDTQGNPANFHWTAGTLSFTSSAPDISPTGPLGPSVTLSPNMTLRTTSLPTVSPTSTLDITGGTLVVAYAGPSPADSLRSLLLAGRITSSSADPTHRLAYLDSFSGEPPAPTPSLTVTLALSGDTNLNGRIDPDDYALLDRSYARSVADAHWQDGDFNYDGQITPADYLAIDTTYLQQQGGNPSPAFLSQRESQFGTAYVSQLLAAVPEPSSLATCGLILLPLLQRRRRTRIESHRAIPRHQ